MDKSHKHIIITGVPRAGKTTICQGLAKSLKYQHLAMDAVMMAFDEAFPETGVTHTDRWDFIDTSKVFIKFMKRISKTGNYDKLGYRLAFDLYHITPKDYYENIDKDCCEIYFFGYPNITVLEKFNEIRKFDTVYDWTSQKEDETVLAHIKDYIEISKWLKEECDKYNLPFIDISHNREKVIDEFVKNIIEKS